MFVPVGHTFAMFALVPPDGTISLGVGRTVAARVRVEESPGSAGQGAR